MTINAVKSMPAIFVGHGNPINIIRHNRWTDGWLALGATIPRPMAILAASAHWYLPATLPTPVGPVIIIFCITFVQKRFYNEVIRKSLKKASL
ncbi:hypothetical protein [Desulfobacterium sp. N47]|uniref:Extradiol ring-cleavage dioxygenase class III enzyme subunit B domain-containing protein n=1 Tax=uncultured Desulfobacterium sp. TaxID=201089 RepID=E1Y9R0_9BACT|nr:hypothetical protein N47_H21260 [uncultured Desulfobacterium sp.]